MTSQSLEIVRHVIWTSVTGGWFYDPQQHAAVNLIQLYFWMFLFCCPFLIAIYSIMNTVAWVSYSLAIFSLFSVIKYINYVLHDMFDTCECIEETDQCADSMGGAKSSEPLDSIEMSIVEAARKRSATVSDTPPAECVSRISDQTLPDMGAGSSAICDRIDHQVDVHRSAVGLSTLDRSSVDQPLRRVTQRNMSSTSFLDHPIDLISELPEEEMELEASEPQLAYAEPLQLDYSMRGLPFGLLMAASEAGGAQHARDGGGMFDLPALLNAVRERMQGSLPPGYFRRTLSVSDASDSNRPTAATAVTGGGQFTDLNAGRSLVELAVRATAPARSTRSASLTAGSDRPCESCTSPRPSGYVSAAQAVDESNLSGSEDDAKDSDSPLLGGSSSKMATVPDDVSAINVWVKDASEGASLSDGTSLHSLTGLDRLFCEEDDNVSQTDAVSTAEQGAVPKTRHRQTRTGGAVLAGRWHASSGHRRRAIRIREGGRGGRSGRSSSPHHHCRRRRAPTAGPDALPPLPSASSTTTTTALPPVPGTHLATSHEDTSFGAVHYFQDEFGNWMTYAFNESGFTGPIPAASEWSINSTLVDSPAFKSPGLVGIHGTGADPRGHDGGEAPGPLMDYLHSSLGLQPAGTTSAPPPPKHHYRFNLGRQLSFKVRFERLFLLALMDRSVLLLENVASVLLALLTSILAAAVLHSGIYQDLGIFFFSFALASCQYCLVKSVQPDAASPTHGHNRVVVFSRAVYFCVLCVLTLSVQQLQQSPRQLRLYSVWVTSEQLLSVTLQLLRYLLLLLPLLFTVGLLPQTDTFLHYLLEQLDRHLFGGTAMTSLPAALYSFCRSVVAVVALYGFAYGGLRENGDSPTAQHILFSIFCGLLVTCCYHLSRSASDPTQLFRVVRRYACADLERAGLDDAEEGEGAENEAGGDAKPNAAGEASKSDGPSDPLPGKMLHATRVRLKSDALACVIIAVMFFAIHCSTVFSSLRPVLERVLWSLAVGTGVLLHYLLPQLRKQLPWLCFAHPILAPAEYQQYEVSGPARIMCFERVLVWAGFFERHILYPLVFLSALTTGPPHLVQKLGLEWATLVVVVCAMKNLRAAYIDPGSSYMVLLFTILLFEYDLFGASETLLVDFFFVSILYDKMVDLLLKLQFVTTYIAPWQITWGSAFHAFAQPFSVPHSAVLIFQAIVSAVLSSPLNPFLGSAVFISSYVRPVKFWERNYNTRRVDHSNTRLSLHLDRNPGANDNNLNSIFYEHLTRSLQHSLYGDILLGRWGEVNQGDCFVLASDYLNCLVHIIELGNGLVTFQMRGLEFRGTYCQQREVEAISEGVEEDAGCCCCEPGRLPHLLSANQIFNQRWLAWQVTASKYVLEGYSITDNSATSMLQVFDLRKVLIAYYVKSIIYYAVRSPSLEKWLSSLEIMSHILEHTADPNFVDVDPIFNMNIDEDYDFRASGITKHSFCNVYFDWIKYCVEQRSQPLECARDSPVVLLCLALSLLGRRALCVASHHSHSSVEFFLYGLHALFKGDFRITSLRDEWVFYDMDLLKKVVSPGIRMSLKLHQDHFMSPEEYELSHRLYEAIQYYDEHLVIAHEGDPAWRNAILSGAPSLLALRHIIDDGSDQYKVIMLNKRHLSFRLIKLNRECVRGLWSGQQQELIFLRNRNSERGSIQNAKQALRNIINSSCDQPIGYPIYVSPLTTSFAETNEQLVNVLGGSISFDWVKRQILTAWQRLCARCGEGCASGGSVRQEESVRYTAPCTVHLGSQLSGTFPPHGLTGANKPTSSSLPPALTSTGGAQHSCGCPARGSQPILQSFRRPIASTTQSDASPLVVFFQSPPLLAGASPARAAVRPVRTAQQSAAPALFLPALPPPPPALPPAPSLPAGARVRLINGDFVYDTINQGRRSDVQWPHDDWRKRGGKNFWGNWVPDGRLGTVVHYWCPSHPQAVHRSHVDKTIVLLRMEGPRYVPVAEAGCELVVDISPENERETEERSDDGAASV